MTQAGFPTEALRDEHGLGAARRVRPPRRATLELRRRPMSTSVLYMSMSLDGFITGPDDGPGQGLGVGGERLHAWLGDRVGGPPRFDPAGPERPGVRRADGHRRGRRRAPHVRLRGPLGRRPPRRRPDLRPHAGRAARAGIGPGPLRHRRRRERDAPGEGGGGRRERDRPRRRRSRSRCCTRGCSTSSRST